MLNRPLLVVTTALLALIGAPFAPARNAILTQIVPVDRLQQANGLLQVAFRAAFFVGPLMLAPLLAHGSMRTALVVNGLTFLGSAGAVAAIRVTAPSSPQARRACGPISPPGSTPCGLLPTCWWSS
ncbi:MFS transporter [Streptomyces scabiei]|uniref:MFS transporter n=1 Tax=Streptomyces scabiei TaxID=1930 RepID=UPI0029B0E289|nr:MFS transporter [Streptomyces scabiei]MDX3522253.1 MFS transporter [Streptomyces scabiei]